MSTQQKAVPSKQKRLSFTKRLMIIFIVLAIGGGVFYGVKNKSSTSTYQSKNAGSSIAKVNSKPSLPDACSGNKLSQEVIVILSEQHAWACSYTQIEMSSDVVTGYTGNPADVTPTGTYYIYAKEQNVDLKGNDGVTSWNDPVSYWMPFLFNQYGAYGFHDATWRTPNQFGHISTASPNASHGCVEMPLASAAWLYSWAKIGTAVTIKAT